MSDDQESASETWVLTAGELDVADALSELQRLYPQLQLTRAAPKSVPLTARQPLRDLSVIDVVVTAIVTKVAQGVLVAAYDKLKELLKPKKGTVKKKPKRRK